MSTDEDAPEPRLPDGFPTGDGEAGNSVGTGSSLPSLGFSRPEVPALEIRRLRANVAKSLFDRVEDPVKIGRFVVTHRIGEGGMGIVYRAYDPELERVVAVKVVRSSSERGPDRRMLREAKALGRLNHPHVLTIYEVGTMGDELFIAAEFVDGGTLWDFCSAHPPDAPQRTERLVELAIQAARGLAAAHEAGLVHRDFKPTNVLIGTDGRLRVADFGLARDQSLRSTRPIPETELDNGSSEPTATGAVVGTPPYMAPEQFEGWVDPRSDQFAWGVTFYEALCGTRPFVGDTARRLIEAIAAQRVRPATPGYGCPSWLHAILLRTLRRDPDERFPSMAAVVEALNKGARRRRYRRRGVLMGAAGLSVLTVYAVDSERRRSAVSNCDELVTEAAGAWTSDRRAAIEAAFAGSEVPFATQTWTRLGARLDAYAEQWTELRRELCVARTVEDRPVLLADRREACLDHAREALDAHGRILEVANEYGPEVMAQMTVDLPPLEGCDDPRWLQSIAPLAADPQVRAETQRVRETLARARLSLELGQREAAIDAARKAVQGARDLDDRFLLAEALHAQGLAEARHSPDGTAEAKLREAFLLAGEIGSDVTAAQVGHALMWRAVELGRHDEAQEWFALAHMMAERAGPAAAPIAMRLRGTMGVVHAQAGRIDEADTYLRGWVDDAEAHYGPGSLETSDALRSLANLRSMQGRTDEALELLQRTRAIEETNLGDANLSLALTLNNIATVYMLTQRDELALDYLERALAIKELAYGPNHPGLQGSLTNMVGVQTRLRRYDEARTTGRRALAIASAHLPPADPRLIGTLVNLGHNESEAGRFDDAVVVLDDALRRGVEAVGPDDPSLAAAFGERGRAHRRAGRAAQARPDLERAVASPTGLKPGQRGEFSFELALALLDLGRRNEAVARARQAREVLIAAGRPTDDVDAWLAEHG